MAALMSKLQFIGLLPLCTCAMAWAFPNRVLLLFPCAAHSLGTLPCATAITVSHDSKSPNRLILANLVVLFVWIQGAHNPDYYGWRAFLILGSLSNVILSVLGLYIVWLISKAAYASVQMMNRLPPKATEYVYLVFSSIVVVTQLVGMALTLAYNKNKFNAIRHFSMLTATVTAGVYGEYSFIRLRVVLKSMYPKLEEVDIDSPSRSRHSTAPNPESPRHPAHSRSKNTSRSVVNAELKVDGKRIEVQSIDSSPCPAALASGHSIGSLLPASGASLSNITGSSHASPGPSIRKKLAPVRSSHPDVVPAIALTALRRSSDGAQTAAPTQASAGARCGVARGSDGEATPSAVRTPSPARRDGKQVSSNQALNRLRGRRLVGASRRQLRRKKRMLRRITFIVVAVAPLLAIMVFALCFAAATNLNDNQYSHTTDKEAETYTVVTDINMYLIAALVGLFQYYALVPMPAWMRRVVPECVERFCLIEDPVVR